MTDMLEIMQGLKNTVHDEDAKRAGWRITRLSVVSWHAFNMDDFEFSLDGTTMIVAQNAVGKSTLLDAITTVLTGANGGSGSVPLNGLTNTSGGGRSLIGYMLGAYSETEFRRDVAHTWLSLSFVNTDTQARQSLVLYMTAEQGQSKSRPHTIRRYIVDGSETKAQDFVIKDKDGLRSKTDAQWAKEFHTLYHGSAYTNYDKTGEYRDMVLKVLGANAAAPLDPGFFRNLVTMVKQRDLRDINGFIRDSLIPETSTHTIENIRSLCVLFNYLKKKQEEYEVFLSLQSDVDYLTKTTEHYHAALDREAKARERLIILDTYTTWDGIKKARQELEQQTAISNKAQVSLKEIDTSLETLRDNESQTRADLLSHDGERRKLDISREIKQLQERQQQSLATIADYLRRAKTGYNYITQAYENASVVLHMAQAGDVTTPEDIHYIATWCQASINQDMIARDINAYQNKVRRIHDDEKKHSDALKEAQQIVANLTSNKVSVPQNALAFRRALTDAEIPCKFVYETITHVDEVWRGIVETMMSGMSASVLVDANYYGKALEILKRSGLRHVTLVNPRILWEKNHVQNNSLYEKVTCTHPVGQAYLKSAFGSMVCADTLNEFEALKVRTGVCLEQERGNFLVMRGWSVSNREMISPSRFLLGAPSKEEYDREMASATHKISASKAALEDYAIELTKVNTRIAALTRLQSWEAPQNIREHYGVVEGCDASIAALTQERNVLEADDTVAHIQVKLRDIKQNISTLTVERDKMVSEMTTAHDSSLRTKSRLERLSADFKRMKAVDCEALEQEQAMDAEHWLRGFGVSDLAATLESEVKKAQDQQHRWLSSYNNRVSDCGILYISNQEFKDAELFMNTELRDIDESCVLMQTYLKDTIQSSLFEYHEEIESYKSQIEDDIQNKLLSDAQASDESNNKVLRRLNKSIANVTCHNSTYRFHRESLPEYNAIRTYIQSGGSSTTPFRDENDNLVNFTHYILDKIGSSKDDADTVLLSLLEPRNWYSYDIVIKPMNTERKEISGKKRSSMGSGGEIAIPFYVVMCAALMSASYPAGSNAGGLCIALFDEAFEKLDDSRRDIFKLFETCGIQAILCKPDGDALALVPLCRRVINLYPNGLDVTHDRTDILPQASLAYAKASTYTPSS